jgi:hypothetical protein
MYAVKDILTFQKGHYIRLCTACNVPTPELKLTLSGKCCRDKLHRRRYTGCKVVPTSEDPIRPLNN